MRDPATGRRIDPQAGRETPVGQDNVRSAHVQNIFRKPPVKAELAVEVMADAGGRKLRAYWGRDGDGSWRGKTVDIGHVNDVSPYAYIRVLDDEHVNLDDVAEMTEEMAEGYEQAIERDHQDYEEANYTQLLKERMQELQYNTDELKKDFAAGMQLFFGDKWMDVAKQLFPKGAPW